jgi:hypothetical protein
MRQPGPQLAQHLAPAAGGDRGDGADAPQRRQAADRPAPANEGQDTMSEVKTVRQASGTLARVPARITRLQHQLSERVHAGGDIHARERGWTITTTTGQLGFGARVYRDPRFSQNTPADGGARVPGIGRRR